ncbi:MAG: penicillin-binding protein 1C [Candidatus Peribacteraceae bacterium]|nr:penicillin-binding protein 1C [Candidatus Peribacteraceae bacterium]
MSRKHLLWLALLLVLILLIVWPLPDSFLQPHNAETTRILDRNGALLYELRSPTTGLQHLIALADVPQDFLNALIATEDRGFFTHGGVSPTGILRALWQNITTGRIVSGGSTLTQQLVRTLAGTTNRTIWSKMKEAFLALKIEQKLTKEEILERYITTAYFGHQAYGLTAAAQIYLGKTPQELSLAECALLAGLLQSPSAYDPFIAFDKAKERQQRVLAAMRATGVISDAEGQDAYAEPITLAEDRTEIRAPHFVLWQLTQRPEMFTGKKEIRTTLDLGLQTQAEAIITRNLEKLKDRNVTSAAAVVLDAKTGDILAMVGSADYFDADHDGAVNVALAARQPGSALKPFTYALALANGATAATTVADTEAQFFTQEGNPYTPRNYDFTEHGLVRYRDALANSYNIAAVKVLERVGVPNLLGFLRDAGITTLTASPEHYGLALTLGDGEVKLLELAAAYGIFPRGGRTLLPRAFPDDPIAHGTNILDAKTAWLITDMLSDNDARLPEFGTESPLNFDFPVAAKTGTTRNSRDNWTLGFTPEVIVGVWVGNADNSPMKDTSGVTGAGPIFHDLMIATSAGKQHLSFEKPKGIVSKTICRLSGKLPTEWCPLTTEEYFIAGTEPTEPDDIFRPFPIDTRNGLLANNLCDQSFVETKGLAVFPKEVEKWARQSGWPQPPTQLSPLCNRQSPIEQSPIPQSSTWLEITRPQPNDSFRLDPLIPDEQEKIIFEAHASSDIRTIDWYVDGVKVGTGRAPDFRYAWKPKIGTFAVEARSDRQEEIRRIEVVQ